MLYEDEFTFVEAEDLLLPEEYEECNTPVPAYLQGQMSQEEWDDLPF